MMRCASVLLLVSMLVCGGCGDDDGGAPTDAGRAGDAAADAARPDGGSTGAIALEVLSSRADMVTGGDALVAVTVAAGLDRAAVRVFAGDVEVTDRFHDDPERPDRRLGRIEGLALGDNPIAAELDGARVELTLKNHPITGPVFSGPHEEPFVCATEAAGLGPALDADCSAATLEAFFYKRSDGTFALLADPSARPADIVQTTTSTGVTLDFVVRVELGTINRAIYWMSTLHDPSSPAPEPWSPAAAWNRKVVYLFGGGCGTGYVQGDAMLAQAVNDGLHGQGFAVMHASLNTLGNNCNDVLSAETAMMVKERFVESMGVPLYTMGFGGSGGSIQQHLIADNYPGILDGLLPLISYPDIVSVLPDIVDCVLLDRYFDANAALWPDGEARRAVTGFAAYATCDGWIALLGAILDPSAGCLPGVPAAAVYDPVTNPEGARCTLQDHLVNVFGRDPATGFARRPYDNAGVVYGLGAFEDGAITAEQLIDLNAEIGGLDEDGQPVPERTRADPEAVRIAYTSGRVLDGHALSAVPIIDIRAYNDAAGDIHDAFRTESTRARLLAANGDAQNHVAIVSSTDSDANVRALLQGFFQMDAWLTALASDPDPDRAAAVRRTRPADLEDTCHAGAATTPGLCRDTMPLNESPRLVAGAPIANDVIQCALVPVDAAAVPGLGAAELDQLRAIFPEGVCDFAAAPPNRAPHAGPWQSYGP